MSGLYPSLEDMKVDQMQQAQHSYAAAAQATATAITYPEGGVPPGGSTSAPSVPLASGLYPSLSDYMGLDFTPEFVEQNMPLVAQNTQLATRSASASQLVAPVTGQSLGLARAEIKQGIRQAVLCKDADGKIGLRVRSVNKGIFVAFVHKNSPASLGGLRFGDQILQINNQTVAGWSTDKAMDFLKKADGQRITFAVRDRPFERTITLQKDSGGHVGFVFKENKVTSIVKDSSAARNGMLIDHHLVEVNGQNVVGLKEKEIGEIFHQSPPTVTVTIIPSFLYEHIMKSIGSSLVKKFMDHSIPDV